MFEHLGTASKRGSTVRHQLIRLSRYLVICTVSFIFALNRAQAAESEIIAPKFSAPIFDKASSSPSFLPNLSQVSLPEVQASRGGELNLQLVLELPEGLHLNEKAPSKATAGITTDTNGQAQVVSIKGASTTIPIKLPEQGDFASAQVDTTLYYCRTDGRGLCYIKSYSFTQPVKLVDGTKEVSVELRAKLEAQ